MYGPLSCSLSHITLTAFVCVSLHLGCVEKGCNIIYMLKCVCCVCVCVHAPTHHSRLTRLSGQVRLSEELHNRPSVKSTWLTRAPFLTSPHTHSAGCRQQTAETQYRSSFLLLHRPASHSRFLSHFLSFASRPTYLELLSILGAWCRPSIGCNV